MAWTPPRNWTYNEIVSEGIMDTHIRDNFNETVPAKTTAAEQKPWSIAPNSIIMVPATRVKPDTDTFSYPFADDPDLYFPMEAGAWYKVRASLFLTDFGRYATYCNWTFPAGMTGKANFTRYHGVTPIVGVMDDIITVPTIVISNAMQDVLGIEITWILQNGVLAGDFHLQFSNGDMNPTHFITVLSGSCFIIDRIR